MRNRQRIIAKPQPRRIEIFADARLDAVALTVLLSLDGSLALLPVENFSVCDFEVFSRSDVAIAGVILSQLFFGADPAL